MRSLFRTKTLLALLAVVLPAAVIAQDPPVRNWTVPAFDANLLKQSTGSTLHPMTHTQGNSPAVFVPFGPCRLTDSRVSAGGPGPIAAAGTRAYDFVPSGCPAFPSLGQAAQDVSDPIIAWSLNFSVVNTQGPGFILAYPTGSTAPPVSVLNYQGTPGEIKNNAAIVPVNPVGSFTVLAGVSGTDVIIDANGVFLWTLEVGTTFGINALGNAIAIIGFSPNGIGVFGESTTYNGVWAQSATSDALAAFGGRDGGYLQGGRHGVFGVSTATTGFNHGVIGSGVSSDINAAGINGVTNQAVANGGTFNNTGASITSYVATQVSGIDYGFYTGTSRIFGGSLTISPGPKSFAAPHPENAGLEIRYASVEAPTVDVYFRGTAELVNGIARIEIPDHFRFTAREGTYMTTLTPVGRAIALSVDAEGPEGIVVRGSGNARFHYVVYAERAEIEGFQPVMKNETFTPEALAKGGRLGTLPPATRALLVRNGTINPDGTYNVGTARAHGWTIPEREPEVAARAPSP